MGTNDLSAEKFFQLALCNRDAIISQANIDEFSDDDETAVGFNVDDDWDDDDLHDFDDYGDDIDDAPSNGMWVIFIPGIGIIVAVLAVVWYLSVMPRPP